jgi:hypothetical protein
MNLGTTYRKTDAGRSEIAGRQGGLSGLQRRVLILVDGQRTVNELAAFVRVGELDGVLAHLLACGLVGLTGHTAPLQAPAAPGFAAAGPSEVPRPATSPEEFRKVRHNAAAFVQERLGGAGEPICEAIERCDNPAELRKLLRGIEIFIGQRLSPETTQAFARHFGSLLL